MAELSLALQHEEPVTADTFEPNDLPVQYREETAVVLLHSVVSIPRLSAVFLHFLIPPSFRALFQVCTATCRLYVFASNLSPLSDPQSSVSCCAHRPCQTQKLITFLLDTCKIIGPGLLNITPIKLFSF